MGKKKINRHQAIAEVASFLMSNTQGMVMRGITMLKIATTCQPQDQSNKVVSLNLDQIIMVGALSEAVRKGVRPLPLSDVSWPLLWKNRGSDPFSDSLSEDLIYASIAVRHYIAHKGRVGFVTGQTASQVDRIRL